MTIKKLSDNELMVEMGVVYSRVQHNFRTNPREYNKARARLRRLRAEFKQRQARKENTTLEA